MPHHRIKGNVKMWIKLICCNEAYRIWNEIKKKKKRLLINGRGKQTELNLTAIYGGDRQVDSSTVGQIKAWAGHRPVCEKCGKCVFYEMYPERVQHNTIEHCVKDVCQLRLPSKCVNLSLHHFFCTWPEFNFLLSLPFPIFPIPFPIPIPKPIPISFQFRFAVHFRFGCYNFNASPSSSPCPSPAQSVWAQTA